MKYAFLFLVSVSFCQTASAQNSVAASVAVTGINHTQTPFEIKGHGTWSFTLAGNATAKVIDLDIKYYHVPRNGNKVLIATHTVAPAGGALNGTWKDTSGVAVAHREEYEIVAVLHYRVTINGVPSTHKDASQPFTVTIR